MFPGDNLPPEFTPEARVRVGRACRRRRSTARSPTSIVVRVTDETVPDAGKKRYDALAVDPRHRARRAPRAARARWRTSSPPYTTGLADQARSSPPRCAPARRRSPTCSSRRSSTSPIRTPTAGAAGSSPTGGVCFQRYNGNGVDPNRDWPDIGYNFRGYSAAAPSPRRAPSRASTATCVGAGGAFQAGDDLHGQPVRRRAVATRCCRTAATTSARTRASARPRRPINRAQYEATKWSPIIKDNDEVAEPADADRACPERVGDVCPQIYAQTWGSVYDTINYTTTGTLGDWFDSTIGPERRRHRQRDVVLAPRQEDRLRAAHRAAARRRQQGDHLRPPGRRCSRRSRRDGRARRAGLRAQHAPDARTSRTCSRRAAGEHAPAGRHRRAPTATPSADGTASTRSRSSARSRRRPTDPGIFNGGMRVEATAPNVQGDRHRQRDARRSSAATATTTSAPTDAERGRVGHRRRGLQPVAAVPPGRRRPPRSTGPTPFYTDGSRASGAPVEWRAWSSRSRRRHRGAGQRSTSSSPRARRPTTATPAATTPPRLEGLRRRQHRLLRPTSTGSSPTPAERFRGGRPAQGDRRRAVARRPAQPRARRRRAARLHRRFGGATRPGGPPTADVDLRGHRAHGAGAGRRARARGPIVERGPRLHDRRRTTATRRWRCASSWAPTRSTTSTSSCSARPDGDRTSSIAQLERARHRRARSSSVDSPPAGDYRVAGRQLHGGRRTTSFSGTVTFTALPARRRGTGAYTEAEKDQWIAKLRDWVARRRQPRAHRRRAAGAARARRRAGRRRSADDGLHRPGHLPALHRLRSRRHLHERRAHARRPAAQRRQPARLALQLRHPPPDFEPTPLGLRDPGRRGRRRSRTRASSTSTPRPSRTPAAASAATSVDTGERDAGAGAQPRDARRDAARRRATIRIAGALLPQPSSSSTTRSASSPTR